jgi:hypothetical protein
MRFQFVPFYRDAFRVLVFDKSTDEAAQMNGWRFHTDSIPPNRPGRPILANRVQE